VDDVTRRPLVIDAIGVVRTVAIAVAGGPLVQCVDGVVRDLEDARGAIAEPDAALERIGKALAVLSPSQTRWLLDDEHPSASPIAERLASVGRNWRSGVEIKRVPSALEALRSLPRVATSDALVLDECPSWFNLTGWVVQRIPDAWIVRLQ